MSGSTSSPELGRRLVANTLHAASGRVVAVLVWLLFTPAILRALGAEGFALWALFFALTGHFAALDFGLVQGTLRHVAASRERGAHAEAGAFATLAVLGFVILGVLWLAVTLGFEGAVMAWLRVPAADDSGARFAMVAGAGVFVVAGFANVLMAVAQGYGRFDLANRVALVLTAQQALGIPIVLHNGWGLQGLVVNVGLGWVLGGVLGVGVLRRSVPEFRWRSPRASMLHLREALTFGGPLQVANVLWTINLNLDKFLLARLVALAAVTPYELGARVVAAALSFPQLLLLAVVPAAAAMHASEDKMRLRALYDRGDRYLLSACAVTLAALLGSADRLYGTWLGPGHADAALVLRGLALASAATITAGMGSAVIRGVGRTDLEAWFHATALTVHLGLSLWLLPLIGLRGALVAMLASNVAGTIVFLSLMSKTLHWPRTEILIGPNVVPILAILTGATAGWGLDRLLPGAGGVSGWAWLALVAAVGGVTALAVTLATRYIKWEEAGALIGVRG